MEVNKIYCGDAKIILKTFPSESVNCCVTSPPYWNLRDYGVEYQLGLEKTFEEYISKLCDIFDEVKRVLRKDGTCWVNMGDTYSGSGCGSNDYRNQNTKNYRKGETLYKGQKSGRTSVKDKSLLLIPQRFAIEMVNRGWIARNILIWWKPNCMPSSAKDRFTVDYEDVYFFVKSKKYWFEQQFEKAEYLEVWSRKGSGPNTPYEQNNPRKRWGLTKHEIATNRKGNYTDPLHKKPVYPQGRNRRAVWTIPTQPFPEAHFAVYPEKLIEPMIKAGCPKYVCKKCGKTRVKILDYSNKVNAQWGERKSNPQKFRDKREMPQKIIKNVNVKELGYIDCGCNAGFESGIVLDPFMGAGTTAVVALKQKKRFIGIEIKQEYIDMATKRIKQVQPNLF